MNRTRRSVLLAIIASVVIVAVTLLLLYFFLVPKEEPRTPSEEPQFVIADWEGMVAVFEGGSRYPMHVYDTAVATLPAEEQEKLRRGIPVEDEAGLWTLLEDYTS